MKIKEFEICESTNDEAWKEIENTPTLVVSHLQTKGRGRQGRRWESGFDGNLYASLIAKAPLNNTHWTPLVAGIAAFEVCTEFSKDVRLKWPNDVFFGDSKMGGILCESKILGEEPRYVVAGLGLNLWSAPELDVSTTCLFQDHKVDQALKMKIAKNWGEKLQNYLWDIENGKIESLRKAWRKAAKIDDFSTIRTHQSDGSQVVYEILDLSETGNLQVYEKSKPGILLELDQALN